MTPEKLEKAANIYNNILNAIDYYNKYETMTNKELGDALMLNLWAELPMWSENSELIDVVIERLSATDGLFEENKK